MLNSLLQCRSLVKKATKGERKLCHSSEAFEGEKKSTSIWNAVLLLPIQAGPILSAPRDYRLSSTRTDFVLLYDE